ncbi:MAG: RNA methyltransferase [Chloroflexi bacterium]|nr:RNA methyltransferase [Chloroflexota bacterium]
MILEGALSVEAALRANSRPIERILLASGKLDTQVARIEKAARAADIPVERAAAAQIDALAQGTTHGGIIAEAGPRRTLPLADLLPAGFIAMLDGIEDPYNTGYAIRALYAAGADGVVIRPRDWQTGIVVRASAGATELIPTATAASPQAAAEYLRVHGLRIAATGLTEDAVSLYDADLRAPLFLLIGGEKRGITRSFLQAADLVLRIPYARPDFPQSLGTAAAVGALAFEVMRQRR